jgi:hypothetical protein
MRTFIHWSALLGSAALAFACGSSSGFTGDGNQGDGDSGASSSSSSGGTGSGISSGSGASSSSFSTSGAGGMGTGTCQTGEYTGTFSCYFFGGIDAGIDSGIANAPDSGGVGPITGTMSFALTQDMSVGVGEGTGTDTASGTFAAATGGFIAATADLTGTLECSQGVFTGMLVNGMYGLNVNGMPVAGPGNTFQGPLDSDYDGKTSTFVNGRWEMAIMVSGDNGACIGTWTATYSGPLEAGAGAAITDAGGQ